MSNKKLLHDVVLEMIEGNSEKAAEILSVFLAEKTKKLSNGEDVVEERWENPAFAPKKEAGKHSGKTVEELKSARNKLKSKEERTAAETSELKSINFVIRSRTGWKSIDK